MILFLSEKPLSKWAKDKLTKYQFSNNLNQKEIKYMLAKDYSPFTSYTLIMPMDDLSLSMVTDYRPIVEKYIMVAGKRKALYKKSINIRETNCYLLQSRATSSCPVISLYHPHEGMKDPSRFLLISKALKNAKRYLDKNFDKVPNLKITNNIPEIDAYLKLCESSKLVCIDLETTYDVGKINPLSGNWKNLITAVGISKDKDEAMCFSRENLTELQFNTLINRVVKINANPNIDKVGQNYIMFDAQVLYWWKVSQSGKGKDNLIQHDNRFLPKGNLWDTMHMFNILYPKEKNRNVAGFSKGLLEQIRMYTLSDIHKDGSFSKRGIDLRRYCALDVVQTFRVWDAQTKELEERGMKGYYEKYRLGLGECIVQNQIKGILIDKPLLKVLTEQTKKDVAQLKADMHEKFGRFVPMKEQAGGRDYDSDQKISINPSWGFPENLEEVGRKDLDKLLIGAGIAITKSSASLYFVAKKQHLKKSDRYVVGCLYKKAKMTKLTAQVLNPNSAIQLREVFKNIGQKLPRNSTDSGAIQTLLIKKDTDEQARELCRLLQKSRRASKFLSTYCNVKLDLDGRLRGSFNVEANDTGRSACRRTMWKTGMNLQTIPSYYTEVNLDE